MSASDRLDHVPMGSQVAADPVDHPRWDGEKIQPYGVDETPVLWDDEDGWDDAA